MREDLERILELYRFEPPDIFTRSEAESHLNLYLNHKLVNKEIRDYKVFDKLQLFPPATEVTLSFEIIIQRLDHVFDVWEIGVYPVGNKDIVKKKLKKIKI
jgi:hypothetical protein